MIYLRLTRKYKGPNYTIGSLYIDNKYFCDTLEDVDRGLDYKMTLSEIKSKKIQDQTAIPTGVFKVSLHEISLRFKNRPWAIKYDGKIPRLIDVPGFDGVLIHPGNTSSDTSGCILVGQNKIKGKVVNSVSTFDKLMNELLKDNDNIVLTID
jgi:hypothetical protein